MPFLDSASGQRNLSHLNSQKGKCQLQRSLPWEMSLLSSSTCNFNFTKPYSTLLYQTKVKMPYPNPNGSYFDLARPGAILPLPLAQSLVARLITKFILYFRTRVFLVCWCPDTARIKRKMLYSASFDSVKKSFKGITTVVQVGFHM